MNVICWCNSLVGGSKISTYLRYQLLGIESSQVESGNWSTQHFKCTEMLKRNSVSLC